MNQVEKITLKGSFINLDRDRGKTHTRVLVTIRMSSSAGGWGCDLEWWLPWGEIFGPEHYIPFLQFQKECVGVNQMSFTTFCSTKRYLIPQRPQQEEYNLMTRNAQVLGRFCMDLDYFISLFKNQQPASSDDDYYITI